MDIIEASKQELIDSILKILVTPNVKNQNHSDKEELAYTKFISNAKAGLTDSVQLPMDYAITHDMFKLIKDGKVFIENSIKFKTVFTTKRPAESVNSTADFSARYIGNEFYYSFLDNHPGIININKLKEIPIDYEGLMAVPQTVLEYKNINRFNIHRVLYTPKHNGRFIYPRVVVSNKFVVSE